MKSYTTIFAIILVSSLTVPQGAMSEDFDMNELRSGVETLLIHEDEGIQVAVLQVFDSAAAEYTSGKDPDTVLVLAAFLLSDGKRTGGMAQQLLEIGQRTQRQSWQEDLASVTTFKLAVRGQEHAAVTQLHDVARESATRLGESDAPVVRSLRNALGYDKHSFANGVGFLFCTSLADQGKYEAAMQAANTLDEHLRQEVTNYVVALKNPIDLREIEDAAKENTTDRQRAREPSE